MNHLPSFIEHSGLYNLRPDEIHADELGQLAPCVRSQDNLPKLTWKEFHAVQSLAYECLHRYGRFPGVGAKEVDKYYRYCIGDELVDRTLHIELPCPQILNPELIESFQREVLSQHALWRAAIGAQNPQDVVMIYPQVVRVGNASPKADIVKELAKVISRETSAREPHEGPRRRQLNYLRPRVVKAMRTIQDPPFVVLGVGDNWRGDSKEISIWLFYRGSSWDDFAVEKPGDAARGEYFAVQADGAFGDQFEPENADFWLTQWVLPKGFGHEIAIQRIVKGKPVGAQWKVEIDPALIIKDADLLAKERQDREGK